MNVKSISLTLRYIVQSKKIRFVIFSTVFAGVKAAVFLEEKISKSRGAAYTALRPYRRQIWHHISVYILMF